MAKPGELSTLWDDLKKSPAVLITLLVAIVVVIYFVYKQNNATSGDVVGTGSTGSDTLYFLNTSQGSPPGDTGTSVGTTTGSTSTTGTGSSSSGSTSVVGKMFTTSKAGSLEDNPRGKVLATVPQGGSITVLAKTTKPDPGGSSKVYYWVNYNGKHGWFGSDNFNVGS